MVLKIVMKKEIPDAIDLFKNDENIASHVKGLLPYLQRYKEQIDYLVARNRQLEEEVLILLKRALNQCFSFNNTVNNFEPGQLQPQATDRVSFKRIINICGEKRKKECQFNEGMRDGGTISPPAPVTREGNMNADVPPTAELLLLVYLSSQGVTSN